MLPGLFGDIRLMPVGEVRLKSFFMKLWLRGANNTSLLFTFLWVFASITKLFFDFGWSLFTFFLIYLAISLIFSSSSKGFIYFLLYFTSFLLKKETFRISLETLSDVFWVLNWMVSFVLSLGSSLDPCLLVLGDIWLDLSILRSSSLPVYFFYSDFYRKISAVFELYFSSLSFLTVFEPYMALSSSICYGMMTLWPWFYSITN